MDDPSRSLRKGPAGDHQPARKHDHAFRFRVFRRRWSRASICKRQSGRNW